MARTSKKGLEYFPMDTDIFSDLKIRKLIKYQSGKAISVYTLLLCNIYKQGYYIEWDDELPFICSELSGFDEAYVSEVIKACLSLGLFSKELFDAEKVLTSKAIQERYYRICIQSRRVCNITDYSLLTPRAPQAAQQAAATKPTPAALEKTSIISLLSSMPISRDDILEACRLTNDGEPGYATNYIVSWASNPSYRQQYPFSGIITYLQQLEQEGRIHPPGEDEYAVKRWLTNNLTTSDSDKVKSLLRTPQNYTDCLLLIDEIKKGRIKCAAQFLIKRLQT